MSRVAPAAIVNDPASASGLSKFLRIPSRLAYAEVVGTIREWAVFFERWQGGYEPISKKSLPKADEPKAIGRT
jgi:hypothetical protein